MVIARPPKLVIFDAFNTLVRPVPGFEETFAEALTSFGIEPSRAVLARLQVASAGLDHRRWSRSRDHYAAWTRTTLRRKGSHLLATFASHVIPALEQWHQAPMEQFPDVAACLASLRSNGITVAVCSNWGWDLADDLAGAGLAGLADVVLSSAEAGCRKPHPDIYQKVLSLVGVTPREAVFVGDNVEADVLGPERAGIRGILLDRAAAGAAALRTVSSLADLAGHIGS
jgi:putative hydrolase of the HAD superfamily